MKRIFDYVKQWDPWLITDISITVKNHFYMIVRQKSAYTENDMEKYLTEHQKKQIVDILLRYGCNSFLPGTINGFKNLLEKTSIPGIILAIVPYQENCLLCVTDSNVYAILIERSEKSDCCTLSIFFTENRINGYNQAYTYSERKTYNVYYSFESGYYVSIVESEKEAREEKNVFHFYGIYENGEALFERYINGNLELELKFQDYDLFNEKELDDIENSIFQPELDIVTACFAYSIFASRIITHSIMPDQIEKISIKKYDFDSEKLKIKSKITYCYGEESKND